MAPFPRCGTLTLMDIPCEFCGKPVDIKAIGNYRRVTGWVANRKQGGTNSVTLPSSPLAWAHGDCVMQEKNKGAVSWDQDSMF